MSLVIVYLGQAPVYASGTGSSRGLWSFGEGAGSLAHDSSGNGNDGTLNGGVAWVDGKVGKALDFDGAGGFVEVPDSDSLDITDKLTLEAWIYPKSLKERQIIICKYNHSSLSSSYYLGVGGTLGTITYMNKVYYALTYDGNHYYAMVSNANLTTNTWTHVAAVCNVTHMSIYINGVLDKVRTYPPGYIFPSTAKLRIGCYLPEAGYPRFFNGTIDEARVEKRTWMPTLEMESRSVLCRRYGETFAVNVKVSDVCNVTGFWFEIHFNTTLLNYTRVAWNSWGSGSISANEATGVVEGNTQGLPKLGTTELMTISFTSSYRHIWRDESTITGWASNLTGLVYFNTAELHFLNDPIIYYERNVTQQINVDPVEVDYNFAPIKGDLNNDGEVEIGDLVTICHFYDVKPGDPKWVQAKDHDLTVVDGEMIIDIYDIIVISSNYGCTYVQP